MWPRAPSVLIDEKEENMILLYRDSYKSIEELSKEELRLAGLRIDPSTNIGSRERYFNDIKIKRLTERTAVIQPVKGMPTNARLTNFSWSPDESKIAFTNTVSNGVELWFLDIQKMTATKLTEAKANANIRDVINWFEDGQSILIKMVPSDRKSLINTEVSVPTGLNNL